MKDTAGTHRTTQPSGDLPDISKEIANIRVRPMRHSAGHRRILRPILGGLILCSLTGYSADALNHRPMAPVKVPQVQVDPQPIKLPVIDGKDIRFKHLSTAEGLSQTR